MSKGKRSFFVILLFFLFFSALFSFHIGLNLRMIQKLENELYSFDQGFTYLFLQHESNPLALPQNTQTLNEFRKIFRQLHLIENAEYFELYMQPLETDDELFSFLGENSKDNALDFHQIDCLQISSNVFDGFRLSLAEGARFDSGAYLQQNNQPIPAILGSEYRPYFQLGDSFSACYLFVPYSFEVCGFLEENSKIIWSNGTIFLDRAVLIPSFDFAGPPLTEKETACQLIHWANKTSGKFKIQPEEEERVSAELKTILDDSPVGQYQWHSSNPNGADFLFGLTMGQTIFLAMSISIVCFLLSSYGIYLSAARRLFKTHFGTRSFALVTLFFLLSEAIILSIPHFLGIRFRPQPWSIVFWLAWVMEAIFFQSLLKRKYH